MPKEKYALIEAFGYEELCTLVTLHFQNVCMSCTRDDVHFLRAVYSTVTSAVSTDSSNLNISI